MLDARAQFMDWGAHAPSRAVSSALAGNIEPALPASPVSDGDVADSTRGRVRSPQNPGAPGAVSELFLSSFNLF